MSNGTFFTSVLVFAAAAAINSHAKAEEPGSADLMQLINEDLDDTQDAFTLELVETTSAKIKSRMDEKIENVFEPLTETTTQSFDIAEADTLKATSASIEMAALSRADFEVGKDVANIENPFEPRLPMAPITIAFVSEGQ